MADCNNKKQLNILLIGEYYSDNLGDGVICETVKSIFLKELDFNVKILPLDISGRNTWEDEIKNNTPNTPSTETVNLKGYFHKIYKWFYKQTLNSRFGDFFYEIIRLKNINQKLKEYQSQKIDIAVFAGGQLFMDYFVFSIYLLQKMLIKKNVPISFNCCGVGKMKSGFKRLLLKKTLNSSNVRYISVRDNIEFFNKTYMKKREVKRIFDPALVVNNYFCFEKKDTNKIGLGVIHPKVCRNNGINISNEQLVNLWKSIISSLESRGIIWELFTNGSAEDYQFAEYLVKILNLKKEKLAIKPKSPAGLINLIASYKSIISFRLHSHIISYSLGKVSVGFIWDEKVLEFAKSINLQGNFYRLNHNITDQEFINNIIQTVTSEDCNKDYNNKIFEETKKLVLKSVNEVIN